MELTQLLRSINLEEESYPNYEDFIALPFLVVFFPIFRFFLDRFVFEVITWVLSLLCFFWRICCKSFEFDGCSELGWLISQLGFFGLL